MIELKNASFQYTVESNIVKTAVKDFSFCFEDGGFYAVIGPNGSGKSTLSKMLNGLYKTSGGDVLVDDMSTSNPEFENEIKRRVGLVFQNPDNQLVATIVEEDVAFGPENLGIEPKEIRERVDWALDAVNMTDYATHAPHKLSGGQKQRIAIAGVLAMKPKYIVLDEPTAMLDPVGRKEVIKTIIDLNKNYGMTAIIITHFMEEAFLADKVLVMNDGNLIAADTPKNIFSDFELLKANGLDIPQSTRLMHELSMRGIVDDCKVFTPNACAQAILEKLKQKGR